MRIEERNLHDNKWIIRDWAAFLPAGLETKLATVACSKGREETLELDPKPFESWESHWQGSMCYR